MNTVPRRTPPPVARDQERSAFADVLERLVHGVVGGLGAALVDSQGETVDYAGSLSPFDAKVAAAHWQIVLTDESTRRMGTRRLVVRAEKRGYVMAAAPDHYALLLVTRPPGAFAVTERALDAALRGLGREAGWSELELAGAGVGPWTRLDIRSTSRGSRPVSALLERTWRSLDVLGTIVGLGRFERGFRVRVPETGAELLLVREPAGIWYTDEIVEKR